MSAPDTIEIDPICFKRTWGVPGELEEIKAFLDVYFERTADWSHSVRDMSLCYAENPPYARLSIEGDFFVESGWRMSHFALTNDHRVVLVAEDDSDTTGYYLLE